MFNIKIVTHLTIMSTSKKVCHSSVPGFFPSRTFRIILNHFDSVIHFLFPCSRMTWLGLGSPPAFPPPCIFFSIPVFLPSRTESSTSEPKLPLLIFTSSLSTDYLLLFGAGAIGLNEFLFEGVLADWMTGAYSMEPSSMSGPIMALFFFSSSSSAL